MMDYLFKGLGFHVCNRERERPPRVQYLYVLLAKHYQTPAGFTNCVICRCQLFIANISPPPLSLLLDSFHFLMTDFTHGAFPL